jgi:hypothetical protein
MSLWGTFLKEQYPGGGEKKALGRLPLQYLMQVARNTGADRYTAMKRMACNKSGLNAANQSKDCWRRRKSGQVEITEECPQTHINDFPHSAK